MKRNTGKNIHGFYKRQKGSSFLHFWYFLGLVLTSFEVLLFNSILVLREHTIPPPINFICFCHFWPKGSWEVQMMKTCPFEIVDFFSCESSPRTPEGLERKGTSPLTCRWGWDSHSDTRCLQWLTLCVNLPRLRDAQIFGKTGWTSAWVDLWRCFWKRFTLESVDWVKKIHPHQCSGYHPNC